AVAAAMTAAAIKPTGVMLLLLPALATRLRWRDAAWSAAGAAIVAGLVAGTLAIAGTLGAFVTLTRTLLPLYGSLDVHSVPEVPASVYWIAPVAGLAVAALLNLGGAMPPRVRVMVGLTVFGLLHLLIQRKGWVYHLYPLAIGLACWGAWSLVALPMRRASVCLLITAATLVWVLPRSGIRRDMYPELRAAAAMQRALESHLSPGARVQMFDSDSGAFLAMTRAGMRQATPYIQWFSLVLAGDSARRDFLASLQANPPAAVLLTSDQWPRPSGFEAADDWPEFNAILTSRYELQQTGRDERIAWRFYLSGAGECRARRSTLPMNCQWSAGARLSARCPLTAAAAGRQTASRARTCARAGPATACRLRAATRARVPRCGNRTTKSARRCRCSRSAPCRSPRGSCRRAPPPRYRRRAHPARPPCRRRSRRSSRGRHRHR